jgi:Type IV secretion-system coupling protein DNA-binding domain
MQINPNKIISEQEFQELLYSALRIGNKTVLDIGELDWSTLPEFVRELMQVWVERIESLVVYGQENDETQYIEYLLDERGITFREFLSLYDDKTPSDKYSLYDAFRWQGIVNEAQRRFFILDRPMNLEGYIKTMNTSKLSLWKHYKNIISAPLPVDDLYRHCYVSGLSGSGKSELLKLVFYHLQKETDHALILLDPHGDLASDVVNFKFKDKEKVIYIDPYLFPDQYPVFNPFDIPERDDYTVEIYTQEIVKVFDELLSGVTLSNQMQALLTPCVATLLKKDDSTLYDLQKFMMDGSNQDLVALGRQSTNPSHRLFFEKEFHNKLYLKTKLSIYTKVLSLLNTQTFFNLTIGKSSVHLEKEIEAGKIIIFNLSKGKMGAEASEAFGRFVISALQGFAQRRALIEKEERKKVILFIDEFHNYVTSSIEQILEETRKFGLHLIFANQFIDQIRSTRLRQSIMTNTDVKILGRNDSTHMEQFADSLLVSKENLLLLKEFEFYVKSKDKPSFKMKGKQVSYDTTALNSSKEREALLELMKPYYRAKSHIQPKEIKPKFEL